MRKTRRLLPPALLFALTSSLAVGQTVPLDVTFGYRFVKIDGSSDEYRTQINDREGLILRNVTFATADFGGKTSNEIDRVIEELKQRAPRLVNTGETGTARSEARVAIDQIVGRVGRGERDVARTTGHEVVEPAGPIDAGSRVIVAGLGLEGTVLELRGQEAEIDVRGKRMRAKVKDLRAIGGPPPAAKVNVNVDLQPREGSLSELNVIGQTVDEAISRLEKFLDESTVTDQHTIRIVHGHGTGQLRRAIAAFLKTHPLVAHYQLAPQDQGGGGATIVELKD